MMLMSQRTYLTVAALLSAGFAFAGDKEPVVGIQIEPVTGMQNETAETEGFIPNRILVKFADTIAANQVETINSRLGVTVINTLQGGSLVVVEVPYPEYRDQIIDAYAATEGVLYAEPDQVVSIPTPVPNTGGESGDSDEAPLIPLPKVE